MKSLSPEAREKKRERERRRYREESLASRARRRERGRRNAARWAAGLTAAEKKAKYNAERAWVIANRERVREVTRLWRYNLSPESYAAILVAQGGKCPLGCDPQAQHRPDLVVDHDHQTGVVRGLICDRANRGLGLYRDNEEVLLRRAAALEAWAVAPPRDPFVGTTRNRRAQWTARRDVTLAAQGNRCAGCGGAEAYALGWNLDHDHACCEKGRDKSCGRCTRDVLCGPCNSGQGNLFDDPAIHRSAVAYLRRFRDSLAA